MMRRSQIIAAIALLLLNSSWSFSPRPAARYHGVSPLYYSSVAEGIAVDTENNVKLFDSSYTTTKTWNSLVPLIPGERGADVTVQWTSPEEGSSLLLQHLFPHHSDTTIQQLQPLLQESFDAYKSLLPFHDKFKARIVATRGPSGTKCPRWHVDHVPMRWIQALVGPGCDYVKGSDGICWNVVNGMEEMEREKANQELVDESRADVRHAKQGQGVVLWGAENDDGRFPAVHKSPSLGPFQGRVLLTLDVIRG